MATERAPHARQYRHLQPPGCGPTTDLLSAAEPVDQRCAARNTRNNQERDAPIEGVKRACRVRHVQPSRRMGPLQSSRLPEALGEIPRVGFQTCGESGGSNRDELIRDSEGVLIGVRTRHADLKALQLTQIKGEKAKTRYCQIDKMPLVSSCDGTDEVMTHRHADTSYVRQSTDKHFRTIYNDEETENRVLSCIVRPRSQRNGWPPATNSDPRNLCRSIIEDRHGHMPGPVSFTRQTPFPFDFRH